jgi:hypothetical protein
LGIHEIRGRVFSEPIAGHCVIVGQEYDALLHL